MQHDGRYLDHHATTHLYSSDTVRSLHHGSARPNPLEPTAALHLQHPLHDGLNFSASQDWYRALGSSRTQAENGKRWRSEDTHAIALPRLPVRQIKHRPRLPPTLSGLHQPPPDAGILPSISVHNAVPTTASPQVPQSPDSQPAISRKEKARRTTRAKWSEAETNDLMKGVARFGIGNWTMILQCKEYNFISRSALDLKDRFRVCRPEDYSSQTQARQAKKHAVSAADLASLGVHAPFERSRRRKRHGYTEEEDARLLRGFERHGKQWAAIQQDPDLDLGHRTRTDLRDRLRTRYPALLQKTNEHTEAAAAAVTTDVDRTAQAIAQAMPPPPLLEADWSFDVASASLQDPITLDRDILDWPVSRPLDSTAMQRSTSSYYRPWHDSLPREVNDKASSHTFLTFDELLS